MLQERSFRRYIEPLRHHSILLGVIILATSLLSLVAAAFIADGLPYEGEAVILLKASGNDRLVLTNGTEFRDTVLDTNRLAQNMAVLVASVDIAQKVQSRGQAIEDSGIKISVLQALTKSEQAVAVTTKGDLVYIRAKAKTTAAATWLANAWADEALTKINHLRYAERRQRDGPRHAGRRRSRAPALLAHEPHPRADPGTDANTGISEWGHKQPDVGAIHPLRHREHSDPE